MPVPGRTSNQSATNRHWQEPTSQLKGRQKKHETLCPCQSEHLISHTLTGIGKNQHHNSGQTEETWHAGSSILLLRDSHSQTMGCKKQDLQSITAANTLLNEAQHCYCSICWLKALVLRLLFIMIREKAKLFVVFRCGLAGGALQVLLHLTQFSSIYSYSYFFLSIVVSLSREQLSKG